MTGEVEKEQQGGRDRAAKRRWRWITVGVVAVLLLAVGLAWWQFEVAKEQRLAAERARAAEEQARAAEEQARAAEALAKAEAARAKAALKELERAREAEAAAQELAKAEAARATNALKAIGMRTEPLADGSPGPEMVDLPGGTFLMGAPNDEKRRGWDEVPQHEVTIQAFAIGKTEVTFEAYDWFAKATGRALPDDEGWGRGSRPVINVSWDDAKAYAAWLSTETGKSYRLPTEAEWEYAARAGTTSRFWWGDEVGEGHANCNGCGSKWDNKPTAPVGSFPANRFGLNDTAGNVWEWVEDCWHDNYEGAPTEGSAWLESDGGECRQRVGRGGSWGELPRWVRSASRGGGDVDFRNDTLGFRLAQDR